MFLEKFFLTLSKVTVTDGTFFQLVLTHNQVKIIRYARSVDLAYAQVYSAAYELFKNKGVKNLLTEVDGEVLSHEVLTLSVSDFSYRDDTFFRVFALGKKETLCGMARSLDTAVAIFFNNLAEYHRLQYRETSV